MTSVPASATNMARRSRSRLKTDLPARIITLDRVITATLRDISLTGARFALSPHVKPPASLHIGETVLLQWADFEKLGHLVWEGGTVAGMIFEELVTPREIVATRDLQDSFVRNGGHHLIESSSARSWSLGHSV